MFHRFGYARLRGSFWVVGLQKVSIQDRRLIVCALGQLHQLQVRIQKIARSVVTLPCFPVQLSVSATCVIATRADHEGL